ncbi:MAG: hypothetical protein JSR66_17350 [Proteobacteria bacterium]|nr:hypothetical protein [Pseudomonadota bacterium]
MAKRAAEWSARPGEDALNGALRYLSLQFSATQALKLVTKARRTARTEHVAKDILRACQLPLLATDEYHVAENLKKIRKGKAMAPLILVRGDLTAGRSLVVADGYHRLCAACHADEDTPVAAILVTL